MNHAWSQGVRTMGIFSKILKRKPAKGPETVVSAKPAASKAKPATKKTAAKKPAAKKAPAKKAAAKKEYNPQCAALTSSGDQCRNSARGTSKYCGSHKGYQPPSAKKVQAKKDTAPAVKKAADTTPGVGTKGAKKGARPQCAAVTADGKQCKNSARASSKYCGSHKGYTKASDASKVKKADTKPRHAGAADTKPSVRKQTTCAAKTKAGKACQRKAAGKSKYCASHKGYRA